MTGVCEALMHVWDASCWAFLREHKNRLYVLLPLGGLLIFGRPSCHMSCKIQIPGLVHFVVHVFMEGVSEWGRITDWTDDFCEIGLPLYGLLLGRAP